MLLKFVSQQGRKCFDLGVSTWRIHYELLWCWYSVGRGGSLVDSSPFARRVVDSNLARRDLGQVLHSQLPVALWCETPTQYPCRVGSTSEWWWTWRGAIEVAWMNEWVNEWISLHSTAAADKGQDLHRELFGWSAMGDSCLLLSTILMLTGVLPLHFNLLKTFITHMWYTGNDLRPYEQLDIHSFSNPPNIDLWFCISQFIAQIHFLQ